MMKLHKDMVSEISSDSDALELYDELIETTSFSAELAVFIFY